MKYSNLTLQDSPKNVKSTLMCILEKHYSVQFAELQNTLHFLATLEVFADLRGVQKKKKAESFMAYFTDTFGNLVTCFF